VDTKLKALFFFVDLVLPLLIGYVLRRRGWGEGRFTNRLMLGNLMVTGTLLGLLSFWIIKFNRHLLWLPVLGVAMQIIAGAAGYLRAWMKYDDMDRRGSYVISAMLSNRGIVGMLTVFILYGEVGYAYTCLTTLPSALTLYLICFPFASYCFHTHHRTTEGARSFWSTLVTPKQIPLLGVLLVVILNCSGVKRPDILGDIFPWLVHVSAWLFVLPLGLSLEFSELRRHWVSVLDLTAIKFLITPALIYALARLAGLSGEVLNTLVILSFSPTAVYAVITCKLHGLDIHLPMAAMMLTTAVYLLCALPLLLLL